MHSFLSLRRLSQSARKVFSKPPPLLDPLEAYQLWAPCYDVTDGNALLFAESRSLRRYLEPALLQDKDILDAGCGTGRYLALLQEFQPRTVTGTDFSSNMIERARDKIGGPVPISLTVAAIDRLPLRDNSFDFVLCTLVLGHVKNLLSAMQQLSRVMRSGATMIISCFHPFGQLLGWQRTFETSTTYAVKYYAHPHSEYFDCFQRTGLELLRMEEPAIDESLLHFYESAGRRDIYERYKGYPMLLICQVRKK